MDDYTASWRFTLQSAIIPIDQGLCGCVLRKTTQYKRLGPRHARYTLVLAEPRRDKHQSRTRAPPTPRFRASPRREARLTCACPLPPGASLPPGQTNQLDTQSDATNRPRLAGKHPVLLPAARYTSGKGSGLPTYATHEVADRPSMTALKAS